MIFLDANVLVAQLNEGDAHHVRISNADLSDVLTNELVFAEVVNVLERRVKNPQFVLESVTAVRRHIPLEHISSIMLDDGLRFFSENIGKLSFTDCVVLAHCLQSGHSLATLDEELASAAKKASVSLMPV